MDPKRAQAYWFIHVNVLNEPDTMNYEAETYGTDFIYRIKLALASAAASASTYTCGRS